MLLPETIHPDLCVYYNGSKVLEVLLLKKHLKLLDLYAEIKRTHNISLSLLILCVDWLFLIGLISINDDGEIILCILKD